ncbi:MAG: hypothetical protein ABFS35_15465 [Bacteroidota bacterium]
MENSRIVIKSIGLGAFAVIMIFGISWIFYHTIWTLLKFASFHPILNAFISEIVRLVISSLLLIILLKRLSKLSIKNSQSFNKIILLFLGVYILTQLLGFLIPLISYEFRPSSYFETIDRYLNYKSETSQIKKVFYYFEKTAFFFIIIIISKEHKKNYFNNQNLNTEIIVEMDIINQNRIGLIGFGLITYLIMSKISILLFYNSWYYLKEIDIKPIIFLGLAKLIELAIFIILYYFFYKIIINVRLFKKRIINRLIIVSFLLLISLQVSSFILAKFIPSFDYGVLYDFMFDIEDLLLQFTILDASSWFLELFLLLILTLFFKNAQLNMNEFEEI